MEEIREGMVVQAGNTTDPLQPRQTKPEQLLSATLEKQMEWAYNHPRQIKTIQANAFQELEFVPDLAIKSYYSIPYKEGSNRHMVEGLSIKAAMGLARWWGNCATDGRIVDEDKSNYYVRGMFIDFETNIVNATEVRVSKFYKPRGSSGVVPWDPDMMRNQVLAGISKARRNAVLMSIPEWLKEAYFNKAKDLVINPPQNQQIRKIESMKVRILNGQKAIMKDFGVTQKEIDAFMIDHFEGLDDASVLTNIQGVYNALKDGQSDVDTLFRGGKKSSAIPQEKNPNG